MLPERRTICSLALRIQKHAAQGYTYRRFARFGHFNGRVRRVGAFAHRSLERERDHESFGDSLESYRNWVYNAQ
jgi:hypothetical protein